MESNVIRGMRQKCKHHDRMSKKLKVLENFNSISSRFAENIAVYSALDVNETLGISYFELNRASNELAQYFARILGENKYIGVSLTEYFLLPCLILGVWKSGNCFAGVGTQYTKENILEFLKFLRIKYIITDKNETEFGAKLLCRFSVYNQIFYIWLCQTEKDETVCLEDFSYAIMTSGTTGEPKIIQVPWSCILPNAVELSTEFHVTELDCIFQASPCSFDPFFIELLITFLNGSSLMIVPNSIKLNPSNLLKTLFESSTTKCDSSLVISDSIESENHFNLEVKKVIKKNITILQMTPSVFQRWSNNEIRNTILSSNTQLRVLILGGEKFPDEILNLRNPQNETRIFNIYGITEISCWAFLEEVTDSEVSIGKPLNSIVYKISENGSLEIGSRERICLINDEKTIKFEHPVYRETGDIVEVINEKIYYLGRNDQIVKKFGMKINLSKIEDSFLKENKLIKECFCIFDTETMKLGLFYVPEKIDSSETNFKRISLEEFHKSNYKIPVESLKNIEHPDYIIEMSETPVNSHGKCNRKILLEYLKKIQKAKRPKQKLETTFRKLWVDVLKTTKLNSSFIELGGNSILGLNLINKLEEEDVAVPQNFITKLLGGKSYDNCLQCLTLAQGKNKTPKEDVKPIQESSTSFNLRLSQLWKLYLEKCIDAPPVAFNCESGWVLVVGSHSSKLHCLDAETGSEIWMRQLEGRIESGFRPTEDGNRGFIGCHDHHVYCIATGDGSIIWKFKTGNMIKSTPCLSSDEKTLFVASYDKNLYFLSSEEGQLLKHLQLSDGRIFASGITDSSLQKFFIGTLDGTCISINESSNELAWKTKLKSPIFASPCLLPEKPEIVFAEVSGSVHSLNALTGEKIWEFRAWGNIYSTPTFLENKSQITFGCHDKRLYCLQCGGTPEIKWMQTLDSPIFAKPAILPEYEALCAATTKGTIYLISFEGSLSASSALPGEIFSSPFYNNGRVFVGCRDNNLYSFEVSEVENSTSAGMFQDLKNY